MAPSSSSSESPGSCSASRRPAAKLTVALDTPGRAATLFSTVAAQLAQSIPSTRTTVLSETPSGAPPSGAPLGISGFACRVLGVAVGVSTVSALEQQPSVQPSSASPYAASGSRTSGSWGDCPKTGNLFFGWLTPPPPRALSAPPHPARPRGARAPRQ